MQVSKHDAHLLNGWIVNKRYRCKLMGRDTNIKTIKGQKRGYSTLIFYAAPHKTINGLNLCARASVACSEGCIFYTGNGRFPSTQMGRIRKTLYMHLFPDWFQSQIIHEIKLHIAWCARKGFIPCVRFNGSSDVLLERWDIIQQFPDVTFYDYTKFFWHERTNLPSNYHLTFSFSEDTTPQILHDELQRRNVAVVFKGGLPDRFIGAKVIDGDRDDLRFLDPKCGHIIGLKAKGPLRTMETDFCIVNN